MIEIILSLFFLGLALLFLRKNKVTFCAALGIYMLVIAPLTGIYMYLVLSLAAIPLGYVIKKLIDYATQK